MFTFIPSTAIFAFLNKMGFIKLKGFFNIALVLVFTFWFVGGL